MKYLKYIFWFALSLILCSCSKEEFNSLWSNKHNSKENQDKIVVDWSASLPNGGSAITKSMSDQVAKISSLYLAVFDEEGILIEIDKANPGTYEDPEPTFTPNGNSMQETNFHVEMTPSKKAKRIIHFIANYDASKANYGMEYDVIRDMVVKGDTDAFWQRVVVDSITTNSHMTRIPLIRNYLKISVSVIDSLKNAARPFTVSGYYVYNQPTSGSVAPFNVNVPYTASNRFASFLDSGGKILSYSAIEDQKYNGYEPASLAFKNPSSPEEIVYKSIADTTYMYERTYNANSTSNPFIIVKGHLGNDADSYYKAAFCYKDTLQAGPEDDKTIYYNLIRDFGYKLVVTRVTGAGYNSAAAAINGLPMNDFFTTNTDADINNISVDDYRLFVNFTDELCVTADSVKIKYKNVYYDNGVEKVNNDNNLLNPTNYEVTISGLTGGDVINGYKIYSVNGSDKYRTIAVKTNAPSQGMTYKQVISIKSKSGLTRSVTLTLREPLSLELTCTPTTVSTLNQDINVGLKIPAGLSRHRFPLTFILEPDEKCIYPNVTDASYIQMPVIVGKSIINGTINSYGFERVVSWDEYDSITNVNGFKTFACHFRLYKNPNKNVKIYVNPNLYFLNGGQATTSYYTSFTAVNQ